MTAPYVSKSNAVQFADDFRDLIGAVGVERYRRFFVCGFNVIECFFRNAAGRCVNNALYLLALCIQSLSVVSVLCSWSSMGSAILD